jgi:site-specific DNA recombinase
MVGIYARVSTEEQARSGFSLQDQIRACRQKAGTDQCVTYMDEGISGEFLDRPALSRLRQDVKNGVITRIVCLDPDRLSRKLMHQLLITEEFDKRGAELVFVNGDYAKTPEGQLFYSMRGAIAEFEKAKINERMSRGRREKARQGRVLRDFHIYGYDYDKQSEQLVINPVEAAVVREIFARFTQPDDKVQGINGIARFLTAQGIPTKKGASVWHRQVVRQILANRTYIGEFYQNRWDTEGLLASRHDPSHPRRPMRERPAEEWIRIPCPSILDEETFRLAQARLEASRRRWAGRGEQRYLLSGLLRCGLCGSTMIGRQAHNWGRQVREYTDKKQTPSGPTGCGLRIRCAEMDEHVWEAVRAWLADPQAVAKAIDRYESRDIAEDGLASLRKEQEKAAAAKRRLLHLYAHDSAIGLTDVQRVLAEWTQKEEQLQKQIASLTERQRMQHGEGMERSLLRQAIDHYLLESPDELSVSDKRELIRHVIREIRVYPQRLEMDTF